MQICNRWLCGLINVFCMRCIAAVRINVLNHLSVRKTDTHKYRATKFVDRCYKLLLKKGIYAYKKLIF